MNLFGIETTLVNVLFAIATIAMYTLWAVSYSKRLAVKNNMTKNDTGFNYIHSNLNYVVTSTSNLLGLWLVTWLFDMPSVGVMGMMTSVVYVMAVAAFAIIQIKVVAKIAVTNI